MTPRASEAGSANSHAAKAVAAYRALAVLAAIAGVLALLGSPRAPAQRREVTFKIDINTAPAQVLDALPGLGPTRVGAIVNGRESVPFHSLRELERRVKGIGPATANSIEPFLQFDEPKP